MYKLKVFASCDSSYFCEHARAWYFSAVEQGYTPIIEVVNPNNTVKNIVKKEQWNNIHYVKVSNPSKSYLCSNRFYSAEKYLTHEGLLITDIDCYFNYAMPPPQDDVGLFFRLNHPDHMKIAAGIVWYKGTEKSKQFARAVAANIKKLPDKWFVDQIALLLAFREYEGCINFFSFSHLHMDWEFNDGSYMWTGKGPRKYNNPIYLGKKQKYDNRSNNNA